MKSTYSTTRVRIVGKCLSLGSYIHFLVCCYNVLGAWKQQISHKLGGLGAEQGWFALKVVKERIPPYLPSSALMNQQSLVYNPLFAESMFQWLNSTLPMISCISVLSHANHLFLPLSCSSN